MRMAGRFSRRVRGYAKAHGGIPVIDCSAGQRKHDLAEEYLAKTRRWLITRRRSTAAPRLFPAALAAVHAAGWLAFFGEIDGLSRPKAFDACLAALKRKNWFVYTRPPFAGLETVLAYLSPLHPPCRHLKHSPRFSRRMRRDLPLQGLLPRRSGAVRHNDPRRRRVHQTLPAPRSTKEVSSDPLLRAAGQRAAAVSPPSSAAFSPKVSGLVTS
jgi:hypothetical protein